MLKGTQTHSLVTHKANVPDAGRGCQRQHCCQTVKLGTAPNQTRVAKKCNRAGFGNDKQTRTEDVIIFIIKTFVPVVFTLSL